MPEHTTDTQGDEAKFEQMLASVASGCVRYIATFAFVFAPQRLRRICMGTETDSRLPPLTFLTVSAFASVFAFYFGPDAARRGVFVVLQREVMHVSTTTVILAAIPLLLAMVVWASVFERVLGLRMCEPQSHHGTTFLYYVAGVQLASLAIVWLTAMLSQEVMGSITSLTVPLYVLALLVLPSIYAFSCSYSVLQRSADWRRALSILLIAVFIISTPAVAMYAARLPQWVAFYAAQSDARALLDTPIASRLIGAKFDGARRLVLMFWIENRSAETLLIEPTGTLLFHSSQWLTPSARAITITGREDTSDPKFFLRPAEGTWIELTTQARFVRYPVDVEYRFWPTFAARTTAPAATENSIEVKLGRSIRDSSDVDRRCVCMRVTKSGSLESCAGGSLGSG
jgi:hypothetical protein